MFCFKNQRVVIRMEFKRNKMKGYTHIVTGSEV